MEKQQKIINGRTIWVFSSSCSTKCPIIYTHLSGEDAEVIYSELSDQYFILVAIEGVDWNLELTPWYSPKVFRGSDDFGGGADNYLQELIEDIIPGVENTFTLPHAPSYRGLIGYSLGGLFAVYSGYSTDCFHRLASVSGSLWYDGFIDFMKQNTPVLMPERAYFSLGDEEKFSKNPRLAKVEHCTLEAEQLWNKLGVNTILEPNHGSHFSDVTERMVKALRWILH